MRPADRPRGSPQPTGGTRTPSAVYAPFVRCFRVLLGLLIAAAPWSPAFAGIPSPGNCYVAPRIVSCPAGDSSFVVILRHIDNNPWAEGCCVNVHLCSCTGYHLSRAGSHPYTVDAAGCVVSVAATDPTGVTYFPLAGGGLCPGESLLVDVGGIWLQPMPRVVSLDQDGDLRVDETDVAIVQSKVGTADLSADFDGDGQVTAADVAIDRSHLGHYAPDATSGVAPSGPAGVALSVPQPNPFKREARFSLTLERATHVEVSVHDVSGRRVASLFDGVAGAGLQAFAWQGRYADGSKAPNGIYFVQVHAGGERLVRRTIFLGGR